MNFDNREMDESYYGIRPLINLLDSTTGSSGRSEQRVKIAERLISLLRKRENSRKEFLSARGVEATLNALDDYDCRELSLLCVQLLTELVENGYARQRINQVHRFIRTSFIRTKSQNY